MCRLQLPYERLTRISRCDCGCVVWPGNLSELNFSQSVRILQVLGQEGARGRRQDAAAGVGCGAATGAVQQRGRPQQQQYLTWRLRRDCKRAPGFNAQISLSDHSSRWDRSDVFFQALIRDLEVALLQLALNYKPLALLCYAKSLMIRTAHKRRERVGKKMSLCERGAPLVAEMNLRSLFSSSVKTKACQRPQTKHKT